MCSLSVTYVDWPQQKSTAGGKVLVVDCPVRRASTNISSCIVLDYMPGFHSPDGQTNVNMKSLEQSLTRCLSLKRHVIDFNGNSVTKSFHILVCER